MKIFCKPMASNFDRDESGIRRVCEEYERHLPAFGVQYVDSIDSADLIVDHAGALSGQAHVSHNHGLYWTADMPHPAWELDVNRAVIASLRSARQVTVPSTWVAHNIARDMRFYPTVIGHGVDINNWHPQESPTPFVLWAKNRTSDACDPKPLMELANLFPDVPFVTTFYNGSPPHNVTVTGVIPHAQMKALIEQCGIYLSTTKETFGIATLEAMAAAKPILGYAYGGNLDLVTHGVNGYLAVVDNLDDLAEGLNFCMKHYKILGENSRAIAEKYTWQDACEKVYRVYEAALDEEKPSASIVIPVYNYAEKVSEAIASALAQTYPVDIIIVDDGSTDNSKEVAQEYADRYDNVRLITKENGGVASARNAGILSSNTKYICCLDADDKLEPRFIEATIPALESDRSLGIAYTGLYYILPDGKSGVSPWPDEFDGNQQAHGHNEIPTACLFRKTMWERLGGYQPRCCPRGAGFEDADFWTRAVEYGWGAKKATNEPLFVYSWKSGRVSSSDVGQLKEEETEYYKTWYPWFSDGHRLFASLAEPVKMSHPVRQYDEPKVSIVIPVGPDHLRFLPNALDSIEAQTFRKWEVIVVLDGPYDEEEAKRFKVAYPYVKYIETGDTARGAGYARNRGAEASKAPMLLFLDADDWLYPNFLEKTLIVHSETGEPVYTDYMGIAYVSDIKLLAQPLQDRVKSYDGTKAVIEYRAGPFDCEQAKAQPGEAPYLWCNITTLIRRSWHFDIGGFDETMESWEDWLYWLKMAWSGHCFSYIQEPLMVYRFYSGSRRDTAHAGQNWKKLLQYVKKQKETITSMGCRGCGGGSRPVSHRAMPVNTINTGGETTMSDKDFRMCVYRPLNKGDHRVDSVVPSKLPHGHYGYHAEGDRFLVHVMDIQSRPGEFVVEEIKIPGFDPVKAVDTPKPITMEDIESPMEKLTRVREEAVKIAQEKWEAIARVEEKVEEEPEPEPKTRTKIIRQKMNRK